jgi:hypothetical protein
VEEVSRNNKEIAARGACLRNHALEAEETLFLEVGMRRGVLREFHPEVKIGGEKDAQGHRPAV